MSNANSKKCPHCGNADQATIEDNGVARSRHDYTLLCVARVDPSARHWDHVEPEPDQIDADGKVACGMQWCPND
jgi:hypothetical protein